ncbi:hypothetical protein Pyrfu_0622 [Pyrolobus fumarii 1A]|uniref:Uncharacterized protein n=1 Tax=Pyrolobus fumarii (strain DSM 11204 / 1A) TaxID=694429 RepID=G0EHB6_PYRF1|nr:hypothetical protein [Pyrolobus fumarii]AEM38491.1 hypothetical protein Pyrfu_0622 [Pyrolobus fumarii 1A]
MPSWDMHVKIAKMLGLDPLTAREVNVDVDAGPLHDIGRRLPRVRLGGWSIHRRLVEEKQLSHLKSIASKIERNPAYRDAFVLHHVIDVLADLEVSSNLLSQQGVSVDLGIIRERVRAELLALGKLVESGHVERIIDLVFAHLDAVRSAMKPWVSNVVKERMDYAQLDDKVYIERVLRNLSMTYNKWINNLAKGFARAIAEVLGAEIRWKNLTETEDASEFERGKPDCKYLISNLFFRLHRRALLTSLYFDMLYICFKFNTEIFNETVLRITKRRAAEMGRYAIRACVESTNPRCALSTALDVFNHYTLDACKRYIEQAQTLATRYSEMLYAMLTHATRLLREHYGCEVFY